MFISILNFLTTADFGLFSLILLIVSILYIYAIVVTFFNYGIGLFGLKVNKYPKDENGDFIFPKEITTFHSFVLMICAHNEENVIQNTLELMQKQKYPTDKYQILVVCDNCTDNTVSIAQKVAKKSGNITVIERQDDTLKGKPYAVGFGLDWIYENIPNWEALSIADADNIYDTNFFQAMNYRLNIGDDIIQGYLGTKNPYDSAISASGMFAYSNAARSYFMARENIGMSSTLGGTGFVLTRKALEEIGWKMESLVEDFEFSTKAVSMGKKVSFEYNAITYDEKPITLKASVKQRTRWAQGHWYICFKYTKPLLAKIFKFSTNWREKLTDLDYFTYLWSPGKSMISLFQMFVAILILILVLFGLDDSFFGLNDFYFALAVFVIPRVIDIYMAVREGYKISKLPILLYYYSIFFLSWFYVNFLGLLLHRNQGTWDKTEHSAQFNSTDLD